MHKKTIHVIFFALALLPPLLAQQQAKGGAADAQENEDEDADYIRKGDGPDWAFSRFSLYTKGDQIFCMNAGVVFPLFFANHDGRISSGYGNGPDDMHVNIGGTGSLAYGYFLTPNVFLGGEIQGSFAGTLAEKLLFFVPVGVKAGYQFVFGRFEFPLSLLAGMATHRYSVAGDPAYWGPFLRPQVSSYFRFNNDWSFGLNISWWWMPQWTSDVNKNVDGHFMDIMLSARYHF
jgi:hypothetical protein